MTRWELTATAWIPEPCEKWPESVVEYVERKTYDTLEEAQNYGGRWTQRAYGRGKTHVSIVRVES